MKKIVCYSVLTTMAVGTVAYGYCHYKNKQLEESEKNEEDDESEKKKKKKKKEKQRKSKKENIIEEIQNITSEIKDKITNTLQENIIAGLSCTTDLYKEMYNSMNTTSNQSTLLCVEI